MIKRILFVFALTFSLQLIYGQSIDITQGDKINHESKKSFFNVLGMKNDILITLENVKGKKADGFNLNAYSKNNNYERINSVPLEVDEEPDKTSSKLVFIDIIDDYIYAVVMIKDKKETFKKYYGVAYSLDLEVKIDWTELVELKIPEKQEGVHLWDWEEVKFNSIDSVLYIMDSNNEKTTNEKGWTVYKLEYFDLVFDQIEFIEEKDEGEKKYTPEFESEEETGVASALDFNNGKFLYVTVASKHKQHDHKPSSQSFYYALHSDMKSIKHGKGKIYSLPDNLHVKDISCYYDSTDDNVIVTGFYNDFNEKKNKPAGIFFISYNVKNQKLIQATFTPTSKEFSEAFNDSKIKKKNKNFFKSDRFEIIKKQNGDYFAVDCNWFWRESSSSTAGDLENTQTLAICGDIVFFSFNDKGNIKCQYTIARYAEKEVGIKNQGIRYYLPFTTKENISYLVFSDNIKNYTNGIYNSKNKDDESDENTCLAVITIDADGKMERKVLINSVQKELGVDLQAGGIFQINDNEYIWYGYKDGVGKVITLKVD